MMTAVQVLCEWAAHHEKQVCSAQQKVVVADLLTGKLKPDYMLSALLVCRKACLKKKLARGSAEPCGGANYREQEERREWRSE